MNLQFKYMDASKELALDAVRLYLGVALIGKGYYFMRNLNELFELTSSAVSYGDFLISHYIVFAHIVGGLCIAVGLLTRLAVAVNIPIVLGAITLVHLKEGFFTSGQGLEISMMVFFLMCIVLYHGSGKLSVDYFIDNPNATDEYKDNIIDFKKHWNEKNSPTNTQKTKKHPKKDKDKAA